MRRCLGLMFLVIMSTVVFTACGGDSSDPTEEALKARAETFGSAIMNGDYSTLYELGVPECRSVLSKEEFLSEANAAVMAEAVAMGLDEDTTPKQLIRANIGIDEDADVEVRASNAKITENQGSVRIEFYLDDNLFGAQGGDDNDMWVFSGGQWYLGSAIDSDSC